MICKYCGADLQEGAATCASCGAAVEGVSAEVVTEEATEVVVPQKNTKAGKGLGIASLILGILSVPGIGGAVCCACLGGFGSILTSIVSIVLGILSISKAKKEGVKSSPLAIIGIVLSAIALLGIIIAIIVNAVLGAANGFAQALENM